MAVNVNETEAKYDAPAGAGLPRLDRLPQVAAVSGPDQQRLDAEYYDTDDLRLLRAGITLRQRSGGNDAGWHLKLPPGHGTRREIRRPLNGDARNVPGELAGLVRAHTRGAPLRPVADDLLRHYDGLRPAGRAAKLARALAGRLPKPEEPPQLTASSPAGQVVLAYLRAQAGTLMSLDPLMRLDEPDAVHQMRVAGRRLRSTLRSFRQILCQDATLGLAADLKWLGSVLGAARDGECWTLTCGPGCARRPWNCASGRWKPGCRVTSRRREPPRAPARWLRSTRTGTSRCSTTSTGCLPSRPSPRRRPGLLPRCSRSRRGAPSGRPTGGCAGPGAAPGQQRDEGLHRARKSVRRARYAAEVAVPAAGGQAAGFAKRMKQVQSVLGEHQDAVIARAVARDLGIAAHLAGDNAFSYGLLYERDACDGERLQARARRIWKKAARRSRWPN